MKRILPLALIAFFAAASTSQADDDVIEPPTKIHNSEAARETVDTNSSGDLNKELSAPEQGDSTAEVRSYIDNKGSEITEHSINGKVYMVRVQPAGKFPAYYLYDNDGDGVFEKKLPGGYKRPSPPMWVIKRF